MDNNLWWLLLALAYYAGLFIGFMWGKEGDSKKNDRREDDETET